MRRKHLIALAVVALGLLTWAAGANAESNELATARAATAGYHQLDTALAAGHTGVVADTAGNTCIEEPGMGTMGIHYANGALFADPARRARLGNAARAIMDANHGARERTLAVIADLLPPAGLAKGRAFRVVK